MVDAVVVHDMPAVAVRFDERDAVANPCVAVPLERDPVADVHPDMVGQGFEADDVIVHAPRHASVPQMGSRPRGLPFEDAYVWT